MSLFPPIVPTYLPSLLDPPLCPDAPTQLTLHFPYRTPTPCSQLRRNLLHPLRRVLNLRSETASRLTTRIPPLDGSARLHSRIHTVHHRLPRRCHTTQPPRLNDLFQTGLRAPPPQGARLLMLHRTFLFSFLALLVICSQPLDPLTRQVTRHRR
jgi:hypothetical protein